MLFFFFVTPDASFARRCGPVSGRAFGGAGDAPFWSHGQHCVLWRGLWHVATVPGTFRNQSGLQVQELAGRRGVKLLQSSMMTASMRDPRLLPLGFHVTGMIWTHKDHKVQLDSMPSTFVLWSSQPCQIFTSPLHNIETRDRDSNYTAVDDIVYEKYVGSCMRYACRWPPGRGRIRGVNRLRRAGRELRGWPSVH